VAKVRFRISMSLDGFTLFDGVGALPGLKLVRPWPRRA
jgi:hypothetical protein